MINVAIVEDEIEMQKVLKSYFDEFYKQFKQQFHIVCFDNPLQFLSNYNANYDLVLMDIELPHMNGIEVSHKLREIDKNVTLVFVTNMAQFAVEGYTVNAFDYIVKPVSYDDFSLKLERVIKKINNSRDDKIKILVNYSTKIVYLSHLKYVEVIGHKLIFHTIEENYETTGTLKSLEEKLCNKGFSKCNKCYLINLRFVSAIDGMSVICGNDNLQISYPKRKDFIRDLNNYLGDGGL